MAISEKGIKFLNNSLDRGRPIPGQSLTNSPEQPYKWESPPEFTNPREGMLHVFEALTVPETVENVIYSLSDGIGVIDLASITLYAGFLEGKWNPDLMTLLMEPTMYIIIALAEKAEIPYTLETGERSDIKEMSPEKEIQNLQSGINELDKLKKQTVSRVSDQVLPSDIREMVEEVEIPESLLQKKEPQESQSLLDKGE